MSNTVKLYMNDSTSCKIMIGKDSYKKSIFSSSALQRPDMQKTRLSELLRKSLEKQLSVRKKQAYWKNFMATCKINSANCNNQEIA